MTLVERRHSPRARRWAWNSLWTLGAVGISVGFLLPFAWMILSSLKAGDQVLQFPPQWLPDPAVFDNFARLFNPSEPWLQYLLNSTIVTVLFVTGSLLSSSLVAFGFARIKSPLNGPFFGVMLATLMIPATVMLIPTYLVYSQVGLIGTFLPLVLPAFLGANVAGTFLLRQFFLGMPDSLDEAARLDGCSWWGVFWRIFLPNARTPLIAVGVLAFVASWNDFLGPLIFLVRPETYTLPLGTSTLLNNAGGVDNLGFLMSVGVLGLVPVILVFLVFQRYFTDVGVTSGLK